MLTHWSVGGCKENSTTLIKTSCAKKNESTDLTTLGTTTITTTTLVPFESTTPKGYESCLEDPDGTCHFLFYDTSLTDSQIGIILLIASLVILCTCLIIIVKILNSMMKGRHCGVGLFLDYYNVIISRASGSSDRGLGSAYTKLVLKVR